MQGTRACGQGKKKLPPLRIKRLKFLLPIRSISGCSRTHLISVARLETKEGMYASMAKAKDLGADSQMFLYEEPEQSNMYLPGRASASI